MSYNDVRHETMTRDETLEPLHTFWDKVNPETVNKAYTWAYQISANTRQVLSQAACHASFVKLNNPFWISSMFFTTEDNREIADAIWDWITSKESPWRRILKNCEEVKNKHGMRVAWLIDGRVQEKEPFNFIKNLAISMRILSEHLPAARFWKMAVDAGMHPTEAYFLSTYYSATDRRVISYNPGFRSGGGHWGLSENETNLNVLKQGDYGNTGYGINRGWRNNQGHTPPTRFPSQGKVVYTKFSTLNTIDMRDIQKRLNEWKKEMKID